VSHVAAPDLGTALAQAAANLIGCQFRLHGRDPVTGLDCVGLVVAALAAIGVRPSAPTGYGLRNLAVEHWLHHAAGSGLTPAPGPERRGDVLLIALGACQHHMAIAADNGFVIHAHAGLRRVVRQPHDPAWQLCAKWRAALSSEG
jgi:cell wall-associated NlpC family hydrolase